MTTEFAQTAAMMVAKESINAVRIIDQVSWEVVKARLNREV
jgi:hypothetical protein